MNENTLPLTINSPAKRRPLRWAALAGIFAASWFLATAIICFEIEEHVGGSEFLIGDPSPRTIFSSLEFSYENKAATQALREQTGKASLPVYRINAEVQESIVKSLNDFFTAVDSYEKQKVAHPPQKPELPKLPFEISKSLSHAVFDEL